MRIFLSFVILLFVYGVSFTAAAITVENALSETQLDKLAHHPTWLKLLHYNRKSMKSEIHDDEFFLSSQGHTDPKAELMATIRAYTMPWPDITDKHPRCQFPARYFWLSQHITFPNYTYRLPQCTRLEKWAIFDEKKTISVILVSGYLGNPASTFGHVLLKLNNTAYEDPVDLLNLSINYGAVIPEHEFVWRYVIRGLLGGYQATYSDRYFYSHDLTYSRTEFRDMWEYELRLSDEECTLLILHLWEILGKNFTYFFLKENCAFRLAELIELVIPESFFDHVTLWYIPVEIFHRLNEIDTKRRQTGQPELIKSIRFIPSSQRKLYHQFAKLSQKEQHAVEALIKCEGCSIPEQLTSFEFERQLEILDTVLTYHTYRLTMEEPSPSHARIEMKNQILLAQLQLPPTTNVRPEIPILQSPADGNRPMLIGVGIKHDRENSMQMHWSPFSQESIGMNSLEGDELVVFDTVFGIGESHRVILLDQCDLIRIRKMKTRFIVADNESPLSWELRIGVERNDISQYDGIFSMGGGRAWKHNNSFTIYAISDISAHTRIPYARLYPHLGVILGNDVIKNRWYLGAESVDYKGTFKTVWGGQLQYQISKQFACFLELSSSQEHSTHALFEMRWYW